jgi:hypothetical protein
MSHPFWLVLVALVLTLLGINGEVCALTPEEVLKLKAAGVSEETIQLMLRNESENKVSADKLEQGYATDLMGTWKLRDGRTITSTGKRQLPLHYPTEYPPPSPYAPYVYPYIDFPVGKARPRSSPVQPHSPEIQENPSPSFLP